MEEFFLGPGFIAKEVNIVDEEDIEGSEVIFEGEDIFVSNGFDEEVHESFCGKEGGGS